jgi:hypothetical protein
VLDIRRREFITLLGGAAAAWPLAARAQQAGKLPMIGFLGSSTLSEASPWVSAFVERLRELGWTEGRNVAMAFRSDASGPVARRASMGSRVERDIYRTEDYAVGQNHSKRHHRWRDA